MWRISTTGSAPTINYYDVLGNVIRSGLDVDQDGELETVSADRITESDIAYEQANGAWWLATTP